MEIPQSALLKGILKGVDKENLKTINENCQSLKYRIGQPLSEPKIIPNNVQIILSGTARLIGNQNNKKVTIVKLGVGTTIGLASLLRAQACEEVYASEDLIVLSIPDKIIIDLYKKDIQFRSNCNNLIYPCEILFIADYLINQSSRTDIDLKTAFNTLFKSSQLKTFKNGEAISLKNNFISFIASGNFEDKKIGEILSKDIEAKCRPPFDSRIIQINNELYQEFLKLPKNTIKEKTKLRLMFVSRN